MTDNERKLITALKAAREGMRDMIGYVPDYFRWKWDHDDYISQVEDVLRHFNVSLDD